MEKITDKMLLDKAIAFCDELLSENGVKKYISNITENHLQYPLDEVVKRKLKKICDEGIDKGTKELSYEVNDEIDELWNLLIEKSVICLRLKIIQILKECYMAVILTIVIMFSML